MKRAPFTQHPLGQHLAKILDLNPVLTELIIRYEQALPVVKANERRGSCADEDAPHLVEINEQLSYHMDEAERIVGAMLHVLSHENLERHRQDFIAIYELFAQRRPIEIPAKLTT